MAERQEKWKTIANGDTWLQYWTLHHLWQSMPSIMSSTTINNGNCMVHLSTFAVHNKVSPLCQQQSKTKSGIKFLEDIFKLSKFIKMTVVIFLKMKQTKKEEEVIHNAIFLLFTHRLSSHSYEVCLGFILNLLFSFWIYLFPLWITYKRFKSVHSRLLHLYEQWTWRYRVLRFWTCVKPIQPTEHKIWVQKKNSQQ